MTKSLMIQGAGSNVGKSVIVAALCRALTNRGFAVRPFKPQNMSNNAAVVANGMEIARAQHLQARACRVGAAVDMNPVLLKPETETGSQVVVHGRPMTTVKARDYAKLKPELLKSVMMSFRRLAEEADIVLVEGAGSPAETNLREGDIANMGFAQEAAVPVLLVGDIDRGGVIAQLVGTKTVLSHEDAAMIHGFMVNRFRGDVRLFDDGIKAIEKATGWQSMGVLPWFEKARLLPSEDAQDLAQKSCQKGSVKVVCLGLSRISNFDDLDPLRLEPALSVKILQSGQAIPGDADIVIVPGTKSTRGDLAFMRRNGWDIDILAHARRGGRILGICGGYQILGRTVRDPKGIEGSTGMSEGLGLLPVETIMLAEKSVRKVKARDAQDQTEFSAYEIHIGRTTGKGTKMPFAWIDEDGGRCRSDGAVSANGKIEGTYLHGLFANDDFRRHWLGRSGIAPSAACYDQEIETTLDEIAAHLERHVDVDGVIGMMQTVPF